MATTTTNFGWDIPQSTDLVKDGATAIAALGQDIDTAMVDLKGGTTGQVLAKATNTDLDFTWVAQDDSNAIQNAIVDAKGDLITASAADTPARLAVGTNGQVLTADSTQSTGIKWASASSGGLTLLSTTSLSGSTTTVSTIDQTYRNLYILVKDFKCSSDFNLLLQVNSDSTGTNYMQYVLRAAGGSTAPYSDGSSTQGIDPTGYGAKGSTDNYTWSCFLYDYAATDAWKAFDSVTNFTNTSSTSSTTRSFGGWRDVSAISSLAFKTTVGTWSGGTIYIYGEK
jgi:hypothetical protein